MEILLNVNLIYVALVLGLLLALMAIFVPGTGLLEISAFALLVYAGYGIYAQAAQVNVVAVILMAAGVIPFVLAAIRRKGNTAYLILSILALALGSAFIFRGDRLYLPAINPVVVIIVSLLNAGFLWIVVRKSLEANLALPVQDLTRIIGATGYAETDIEPEGTVQVSSELWSARSSSRIPKGAIIRVTGRDGFTLTVEAIKKPGDP